jgi:ferric-dicitrate binding protein FerR (iron transport regulator)
MSSNTLSKALATRLQQILDQRKQHQNAIQRINQTLEQIQGHLAAAPLAPQHKRPAAAVTGTRVKSGNHRP